MSIGSGIFLIALGAILAFAVEVDLGWIELSTVGYILMAAGALMTIVGIALLARRRQQVTTSRTTADPGATERRTVTEQRRDDTV